MIRIITAEKIIGIAMIFALGVSVLYASETSGTLTSHAGTGSSSSLNGTISATASSSSSSETSGTIGGGTGGGGNSGDIRGVVVGGSNSNASGGSGSGSARLTGNVFGDQNNLGVNAGTDVDSSGLIALGPSNANSSDFGTGGGFDPEIEALAFQNGGLGVDNSSLAASAIGGIDDSGATLPWTPIAVAAVVAFFVGYGIIKLLPIVR
ncbi:hypothetical protein A2917_01045 [Candidatus Nomurabacteria bacterium RIFCSPLOWO2_01_FULL_42_17]|uniref:Uncharacterized protein n=1 Tax=Candidatus Nomurabacteria bacterium RIFCSPLOWO2_01_FULL_42_17 TaxID=1801780 RepID=A0A1F6XMB3_9BACT|nr:MAG: hypothetical protein A2917_01045 [Candidatus Nomurabacteria bacterium RIFCSPLOWO2_01_FULL_42_17]